MGHKKTKKDLGRYQAWKNTPSERRRWERYPPEEGVLALLEGHPYRILDISRGGFAVYDYGGENVPDHTLISLHDSMGGFFLDALRCRKVSESRVVSQSTSSSEVIRRIGLEILDDDPDLGQKLAPFMRQS